MFTLETGYWMVWCSSRAPAEEAHRLELDAEARHEVAELLGPDHAVVGQFDHLSVGERLQLLAAERGEPLLELRLAQP